MNKQEWQRHRINNVTQSVSLLLALATILCAIGWAVAGWSGALLALIGGIIMAVISPKISPALILRMYRTKQLTHAQAPALMDTVTELSKRAQLEQTPKLYYVPSPVLNAFAVGHSDKGAIALTDGIIRRLNLRELTGVLAHELSHIRNKDTWVMGMADLFSRMTHTMSMAGQFLLLVSLPMMLFGGEKVIGWLAILVLIFAPAASSLIQLALSRTREYDADLGAVELTRDPHGLAQALQKMQQYQGRRFEQILLPGRKLPDPSLLRTHPPTDERIERLMALSETGESTRVSRIPDFERFNTLPPIQRVPRWRWHMMGLWY